MKNFLKINFYEKFNKKSKNKEKIFYYKLNNLTENDIDFDSKLNNLIENYNTNLLKEEKLLSDFKFDYKFNYYASIFVTNILFFCISFIISNYLVNLIYIRILILLFLFSLPLIYKYWVIQTSKYYEQFI